MASLEFVLIQSLIGLGALITFLNVADGNGVFSFLEGFCLFLFIISLFVVTICLSLGDGL